MNFNGSSLRLYLVADPDHCSSDLVTSVAFAIRGGVTMVQYRDKFSDDDQFEQRALQLRTLCDSARIPLIINDRVDIAIAIGADGVHLGVDDVPIERARELGGPEFIIGYSPEADDDLTTAKIRGCDYLGIGPVFGTKSKDDAGDALGLPEFSRRMQLGTLPTVGIGGVNVQNYRQVLLTGAQGVAVISAILGATDIESAARQLSEN